jgi:hypothetical protein
LCREGTRWGAEIRGRSSCREDPGRVEAAISRRREIDAALLELLEAAPSRPVERNLLGAVAGDLEPRRPRRPRAGDPERGGPPGVPSRPRDAFASLEKSVDLFREMNAAMERKDWVSLADLIQYELSPLLEEGRKEFTVVRDLLSAG